MRVCLLALLVGCGSHSSGGGGGPDLGSSTTPPTVLATFDPAQLNGQFLALELPFLYFGANGNLMRIPTVGGAPDLIGTGITGPFVLDAVNAYGFDASGIASVPKVGGTVTSLHKGTQLGRHLAVDNTTLYFHDYYGQRANGDNYHQSIFALTLATGAVTNIATNQFVTGPFAQINASLYWFSDNCPPGQTSLMQLPLGGTPAAVFTDEESPGGPIVVGEFMLWTNFGGCAPVPPSQLHQLAPDNTQTVIADGLDMPGDLASDDVDVFVAEHFDSIVRIRHYGGGAPTAFAKGLNRPGALVVDNFNVYWINAGDGTIVSKPK